MTPEQERLANAMLQGQFGISPTGPVQPETAPPPQQDRSGANLRAAGQLALMALPVTRLGRAMVSTLPRAAATGVGAGLAIEGAAGGLPSAQAAEPTAPAMPDASTLSRDDVLKLQGTYKAQGRYKGPLDGTIDPGGPTHRLYEEDRRAAREAAALSAKRAADAAEREAATAAAKAQADAAKAAAEAKTAEAQGDAARAAAAKSRFEQSKIEATEAEKRRQQAAAAGKKLEDWKGSLAGILSQTGLTVGPYLGATLGYWAGHKLQGGIGARGDAAAQARANRADTVMRSTSPKGTSADIARTNRFWGEGGGREPFDFLPNANPRAVAPYRTAQVQTPASQLYNQSLGSSVLEGSALPIAGLAEHLLTEFTMNRPAQERLQKALDAVNKEPSDVNIQSLQNAMIAAGFGQLLSRLGLGMMAGSFGQTMTHRVVGGMPRARPATLQKAEAERARLQNILAQPLPPRGAAAPPPAPLPALPPPGPGQAQPLGVPPLALPAPRPRRP